MDSLRRAMHAEVSGVPPLGDIDRAIQHVSIVRRRWAGLLGLAAAMVGLVVALNGPWWQPGVVQPVAPQPAPTRTSARGAPASMLLATIPVEGRAHGIAVDPATGSVLVALAGANAVSVIDAETGSVIDSVSVYWGQNPWDVAVDPTTGQAFVTYPNGGKVVVVNTATWDFVAEIEVGTGPGPVAVDPVGGTVYVGNMRDGTVSVIDTQTRQVVDTVTVVDSPDPGTSETGGPLGLAVDPTSGDLYVANGDADTVSVIGRDSREVVSTITGLDNPQAVAVDPSTAEAYVSNGGDGTMSVIDTRTRKVVDTIEDVDGAGVAVDPAAGVVYVNADGLTVIDTGSHQVIDTIEGAGGYLGIAVDPATGRVYVANGDWGNISVFGAP